MRNIFITESVCYELLGYRVDCCGPLEKRSLLDLTKNEASYQLQHEKNFKSLSFPYNLPEVFFYLN